MNSLHRVNCNGSLLGQICRSVENLLLGNVSFPRKARQNHRNYLPHEMVDNKFVFLHSCCIPLSCITPLLFTSQNFSNSCFPNLSIDLVATNAANLIRTPSINSLCLHTQQYVLQKIFVDPLKQRKNISHKIFYKENFLTQKFPALQ